MKALRIGGSRGSALKSHMVMVGSVLVVGSLVGWCRLDGRKNVW